MLNPYQDTEITGRIVAIESMLSTKFDPINRERHRNYNMTISALQWEKADKEYLEGLDRPAYSYNLISPILKTVSGYEKGGRKKLQTVGRTEDDFKSQLIMNHVVDYELTLCNFDFHKSKAFMDAIIARWGWLMTYWSYENNPLGDLVVRRYNPFQLMFDMDFSSLDFQDGKYILDRSYLTEEEILMLYALDNDSMWEEIHQKAQIYYTRDIQKRKGLVATWINRLVNSANSFVNYRNREDVNLNLMGGLARWFDQDTGRFEVLEMHEKRLEKRITVFNGLRKLDITDIVKTQDERGFDRDLLHKYLQETGLPPENVRSEIARQTWITTIVPAFDMKLQDQPYPVQNNRFMFTPVFAYDFHADPVQTQSMVDELIDPQSSYNKRRSTMLDYIVKHSAMGYVFEDGAITGHEDGWQNRKMGDLRFVNQGFWEKWKQDQPPQMNNALAQYEAEDEMLFEKISGITKASKGQMESAGESGKLYIAKKEQSEVMLEMLFDNLDLSTIHVGRNVIDYIQHYMTEEQIIRITNDGSPYFLTINQKTIEGITNDITVGQYDLEISQMPYGRTARETEFLKFVDMMEFIAKVNPQIAMLLLPVYIKASDTPYKAEMLEIIQQAIGVSVEQIIQQLALEQVQQQLGLLQQQQGLNQQNLQMKNQSLQNEDIQGQLGFQQSGQGLAQLIMNALSSSSSSTAKGQPNLAMPDFSALQGILKGNSPHKASQKKGGGGQS